MKRILSFILLLITMLGLCACSTGKEINKDNDELTTKEEKINNIENNNGDGNKMLIAYFSWSGNTETLAKEIKNQTGATLFELQPETPYPTDYNEVLNIAQSEQREKARPKISKSIDDFDKYDTVFIGFPNWYYDMPMIIYSFIEQYDFEGKTVIPFCTSGGSGFSSSESTLKENLPKSTLLKGLAISGSSVNSSKDKVEKWLQQINILN